MVRCMLQSSPEIKAFMADNGLKDVAALETYFEGRVLGLARQAGRNYIVWQVAALLTLMQQLKGVLWERQNCKQQAHHMQ
jgi:N-acetyl-beta-hexosaminidase